MGFIAFQTMSNPTFIFAHVLMDLCSCQASKSDRTSRCSKWSTHSRPVASLLIIEGSFSSYYGPLSGFKNWSSPVAV